MAIHLMLQGKGGVGKSFCSSMMAMFFDENKIAYHAYDTDPVNATFNSFKALNVKHFNIMAGEEIDQRSFDVLIEDFLTSNDHVIVDTGSNSFISLCHYLLSNDIFGLLTAQQKKFYIHTVIGGGQTYIDTFSGFDALASQFPENCKFIVWKNSYLGDLSYKDVEFEDSKKFKLHKKKIFGIINLPSFNKNLHTTDLNNMLEARLTFSEVASGQGNFKLLEKHRLNIVKNSIFDSLSFLKNT